MIPIHIKKYFLVACKGMLMGAADIVPGVSGGTMAFITGIYERLIDALHSFGPQTLKDLFSGKITKIWSESDSNFLLALGGGLVVSVLLFSSLVSSGLESYPHLMYALFAGLIIASAEMIAGRIDQWKSRHYLALMIAMVVGILITQVAPAQYDPTTLMIFFSAAIAICAMILPGISGSFILLLLGMYEPVIEAVHERDFLFIAIFGVGAVVGLLSFVRVVKYFFKSHHDVTIAVLIGLMLGSLPKLWPWAQEGFEYSSPLETPLAITAAILGLFLLGYMLVKGIEKYTQTAKTIVPDEILEA